MNNKCFIVFLFVLLAIYQIGWSQNNPLSKKISITITNQPVEKALQIISKAGNINFSYNSDIIPLDSIVSFSFNQKETLEILNYMFHNKYFYETTGQHIIIQKKKNINNKAGTEKTKIIIIGKVVEFDSGKKIYNASVYNINGNESVLSDTNGNFSITILQKEEYVSLAINKQFYEDTIIIKPVKTELTTIALRPKFILEPIAPKESTVSFGYVVDQSDLVQMLVKSNMMIHANNISYNKQRPAQISLFPFIGSNYKLSGTIVNKVSLNVVSGYSYGVAGVEIGGVLNINRKNITGVQVGGFGNITGNATKGLQVAGFFNHNFGKVAGVQIAGFYNNVCDTVEGAQMAGFANITTKSVHGIQVAGFFNYAKKVNGVQIGVVNIADTISGISIGVFNIIKKGFHQLTLYTDEMGSINYNISLGTNKLYTTIGLTSQPFSDLKSWGILYGFGSQLLTLKTFNININLTENYLNIGKIWDKDQSQLYKLSADFNFKISKHFLLFTGPSFNIFRYSKERTDLTDYPENYLFAQLNSTIEKKSIYKEWFGVSLGSKYRF